MLRLPDAELRMDGEPAGRHRPERPVGQRARRPRARRRAAACSAAATAGSPDGCRIRYGVNRYHDRLTGESFDGDYDQRHTFNAYGLYRLTNRFSLAGKLRIGSNTPATGYWEQRNGEYFVGSTRNALRVPTYARLDLRANRTFNWETRRLTLFVEVMNVLGRENVRYELPGVDLRTGQAFGMFNSMIPLVPSAGILIEF